MIIKRGSLIVFEGCDRAGKTTQCKRLVEKLQKKDMNVKFMNFPNRKTETGKIIDSYLTNKLNLTDEGIHLLFSVNRWEVKKEMERELKAGELNLIMNLKKSRRRSKLKHHFYFRYHNYCRSLFIFWSSIYSGQRSRL
jgi:archaellum biogenesis ATPase FlaH